MARIIRKRWYSAQGQQQLHVNALERSSGLRRLISLVIMLAMVLLLLEQTSNVKKVESVATAIGLLPIQKNSIAGVSESQGAEGANANLSATELAIEIETSSQTNLEYVAMQSLNPLVRSVQPIWKELLNKANAPTISALARKLFKQEFNEASDAAVASKWNQVLDWHDRAGLQLANWEEVENANSPTLDATRTQEPSPVSFLKEAFQNHRTWFTESSANEPDIATDDFFQGLAIALDEKLLEQVIDNSSRWSTDRHK